MRLKSYPQQHYIGGTINRHPVKKGDLVTVTAVENVEFSHTFHARHYWEDEDSIAQTQPIKWEIKREIFYTVDTCHKNRAKLTLSSQYKPILYSNSETLEVEVPVTFTKELCDTLDMNRVIYELWNYDGRYTPEIGLLSKYHYISSDGGRERNTRKDPIAIGCDMVRTEKETIDYNAFIMALTAEIIGMTLKFKHELTYRTTIRLDSTYLPSRHINCRVRNIHYDLGNALSGYEKDPGEPVNVFPQDTVINWSGIILDETIRKELSVGNIVRVPTDQRSHYYRIVHQLSNGNFFACFADPYGGWHDTDDRSPRLMLFGAEHVSEIPTHWRGNENLLSFDKDTGPGYNITGCVSRPSESVSMHTLLHTKQKQSVYKMNDV